MDCIKNRKFSIKYFYCSLKTKKRGSFPRKLVCVSCTPTKVSSLS